MNGSESIEWLFSLHRFGMKLGLENILTLTDALGRPQDRFASVLIAGTNGKGSTAAMLHAILGKAGIRSGLYSSPHLVRTEERIRIGDRDIESDELSAILTEVRVAIETLLESGRIGAYPTFFEAITAAAFVAFTRAGVEVAVLEVGLGGRLDATNIVTPVLSIITSIDLDHQEQLGPTLASIAREKAGILRADAPALIGDMDAEALASIREQAALLGARLVHASDGCRIGDVLPAADERPQQAGVGAESNPSQGAGLKLSRQRLPSNHAGSAKAGVEPDHRTQPLGGIDAAALAASRAAQTFSVVTPVREYPRIACPLPGIHQRGNALLAIRAAEMLAGIPIGGVAGTPAGTPAGAPAGAPAETRAGSTARIDAAAIVGGLAASRWPGRLEWVEGTPPLLLDGAHNPAGCRALAEYLAGLGVRPVLLFAVMRDKEIETMLASLLPRASGAVFTAPPMPRAAEPARLLELASRVYRGIGPVAGAAVEMSPMHNPAETILATDSGRFAADPDVASALAQARRLSGRRGLVVVAGSLFLIGAVKEVLLGLPVRAGESG